MVVVLMIAHNQRGAKTEEVGGHLAVHLSALLVAITTYGGAHSTSSMWVAGTGDAALKMACVYAVLLAAYATNQSEATKHAGDVDELSYWANNADNPT